MGLRSLNIVQKSDIIESEVECDKDSKYGTSFSWKNNR